MIRSHDIGRELIRTEAAVTQAGFGATEFAAATGGRGGVAKSAESGTRGRRVRRGGRDVVGGQRMRSPILYLEGTEHRTQRRAVAKFFLPRTAETYRAMMDRLSDDLIRPLGNGKPADVARLSLPMAVQVAARVIGLTDSALPGMGGRLESFFGSDLLTKSWHPRALWQKLRSSTALLQFYYLDVLPAIRARRKKPQEDVIGHLLLHGYTSTEILTECVTYAAAGMVTTREFITLASWHLIDDPSLLERFQTADRDGRIAVLEEILRLEPVVGHLYRLVVEPLTFTADGVEHELPVGTMIDFDIRAINADAGIVGDDGLAVRPGRELSGRGVSAAVMSFGDGNHRCPGAPIAMAESEIFLSRLFRDDLVMERAPDVAWGDITEGYELRGLKVRLA